LIEKDWASFGHKFLDRLGLNINKKGKNDKAPIFLQWLDCVYQLIRQFPFAFEFNEELLIALADAMYDCRFGTFINNCEKEKKLIMDKTVPIWYWVNSETVKPYFINSLYIRCEDVLIPSSNTRSIKLWENYWLRWDPDRISNYHSLILSHKTKPS